MTSFIGQLTTNLGTERIEHEGTHDEAHAEIKARIERHREQGATWFVHTLCPASASGPEQTAANREHSKSVANVRAAFEESKQPAE